MNKALDRQEDIALALDLLSELEPVMERLNLYWHGDLAGLRQKLREME